MILTENLITYIREKGKWYTPAPLPLNVDIGRAGDCFDHCMMQAMQHQKSLRYVEGIAADPITGQWILHAWLTDAASGTFAFDPTWRVVCGHDGAILPVQTKYIGVEIPLMKVAAFVRATEHKSVFANGGMNPELANAALPAPLF